MVAAHQPDQAKSDTIDCTDGRTCLLEAVEGLNTEAFDIPNVVGSWSVRDCLAHLVGWDAWGRQRPGALRSPACPSAPSPQSAKSNDAAPGDWRNRPLDDLLNMLRQIRDTMGRPSQSTDR